MSKKYLLAIGQLGQQATFTLICSSNLTKTSIGINYDTDYELKITSLIISHIKQFLGSKYYNYKIV
jgi:hypothetical protein